MILEGLAILIAILFTWEYFARDQRKAKLSKQFSGPFALPFIGNLYMYLGKKPEGERLYIFVRFPTLQYLR